MATGERLSFEANRDNSGKYWCSADNGLSAAPNASANLDVQCKFELTYYANLFNIIGLSYAVSGVGYVCGPLADHEAYLTTVSLF